MSLSPKPASLTTPTTAQLRAALRAHTATLRGLGVHGFAYPTDAIGQLPRSTLISCISWAVGTIAHVTG